MRLTQVSKVKNEIKLTVANAKSKSINGWETLNLLEAYSYQQINKENFVSLDMFEIYFKSSYVQFLFIMIKLFKIMKVLKSHWMWFVYLGELSFKCTISIPIMVN